jgi:hypothetical protein
MRSRIVFCQSTLVGTALALASDREATAAWGVGATT